MLCKTRRARGVRLAVTQLLSVRLFSAVTQPLLSQSDLVALEWPLVDAELSAYFLDHRRTDSLHVHYSVSLQSQVAAE